MSSGLISQRRSVHITCTRFCQLRCSRDYAGLKPRSETPLTMPYATIGRREQHIYGERMLIGSLSASLAPSEVGGTQPELLIAYVS